jgi:hypothetical protein
VDFHCVFTIISQCFKQQGVIAAQIQMKCCRSSLATHTVVMVTAGWPSPGSHATHSFDLKGSTCQQVLLQHLILVRSHIHKVLLGEVRSLNQKMAVFQDGAPCSLVDSEWYFRGAYCLHYQGESPDYMVQHPKRQQSSYLSLSEPEASPSVNLLCR